MHDAPLWQLSAVELQRRYRERSSTPLDVVRAIHARIDAVNPRVNAVVSRRDAAVLEEAEKGLPIGLQLIGGYGRDDLLLDLGAAYESRAPWAQRWPTLRA